jgi:hypothetical protein
MFTKIKEMADRVLEIIAKLMKLGFDIIVTIIVFAVFISIILSWIR